MEVLMERVTGIGGVFFRANDPGALLAWYQEHLGIAPEFETGSVFHWRDPAEPDRPGSTTWAIFPADTTYFGAMSQSSMINYRVRDLDAMLDQLRRAGAEVDERVEVMTGYGRFGWASDPAGNRFELWEPE
jgi:predicted enzyme related to lactoylglutathione lyase